jgi:hypothetical protein
MTQHTPDLTAPEVMQHALSTLQDHLPLHAEGYVCTTDDLLKAGLGGAVQRSTPEAVCADLVGTPDPQTIRGYLKCFAAAARFCPAPDEVRHCLRFPSLGQRPIPAGIVKLRRLLASL